MKVRRLIVASWLAGTAPAWALSITPSHTEIRVNAGASTPIHFTALNDDRVEVQVDVSKKNWVLPEENKAWTVDRWLDLHAPGHFALKPGESKRVEATVTCPASLRGEVSGMVSFLYRSVQPSSVTPMISVSVYLMAAGTEVRQGLIQRVQARAYNGQLALSATVKDTGNVHLRPSGRFVILNSKGTEVAQVPIPEGRPVYPGTDALYFASMPRLESLAPGRYTARAELADQDVKMQGKQPFKILPDGKIEMSAID